MAQRNGAPSCPKPERLEALINLLEDNEATAPEIEHILPEICEALDWLHTHLTSRNIYHKKQQIKKTILDRLLREKLGEDYDDLSRQAEEATTRPLQDYVAGGE